MTDAFWSYLSGALAFAAFLFVFFWHTQVGRGPSDKG